MMAEKSAAAEAMRKRKAEKIMESIEETKDPGEGGSGTKEGELDVKLRQNSTAKEDSSNKKQTSVLSW